MIAMDISRVGMTLVLEAQNPGFISISPANQVIKAAI